MTSACLLGIWDLTELRTSQHSVTMQLHVFTYLLSQVCIVRWLLYNVCSHFVINYKVLVYLMILFGVHGVVLGVLLFVRNVVLQLLSLLLISPLKLVQGRGYEREKFSEIQGILSLSSISETDACSGLQASNSSASVSVSVIREYNNTY